MDFTRRVDGDDHMTVWELSEREPPRLEAVYKVRMESREKLVVDVKEFVMHVKEGEIRVTITMELDRTE